MCTATHVVAYTRAVETAVRATLVAVPPLIDAITIHQIKLIYKAFYSNSRSSSRALSALKPFSVSLKYLLPPL